MPTGGENKDRSVNGHEDDDGSSLPVICDHCGNPFHLGQGVVTSDMALCDICNGD